ncbi:MAG: hypothetical protein GY906_16380 [bacterium]|nr:hypothetical protein [bacterium]
MSSIPAERELSGATDLRFEPDVGISRTLIGVATVSGALTLLGILIAPDRTWPNILVAALMAVCLALGCQLFLAFRGVTSAGWSTVFKRVPEAAVATLPFIAPVLLLVLAGGMGVLFEWSHADVMATDSLLASKSAWLNVPFFLARAVLIFGIWVFFGLAMLRLSRRQDCAPGPAGNRRHTVLSSVFLVVFAITFSVASFDWIMSLEPHWFSTIFAVYHFTGALLGALALISIIVIILRRRGYFASIVNDDHLLDLGKLMMGFSAFWAYIWFSQYMLIWYSNLPEEVGYYMNRHTGAWAVLAGLNVLINWVVPFLVLLPRAAKRNEGLMLKAAGLLLVGRWLDLYLAVNPVFQPQAPLLGVWELAPLALGASLFLIAYRHNLASASLLPKGDAFYEESLHHHI